MPNPEPRISLITTVLNEADNVADLLATMTRQTRQPDEIVIVDGGSTDGTTDVVAQWSERNPGIRLVAALGANISQGRNLAWQTARGEIIAITDAGVRLADDWLACLVQPLLDDPACMVVGGFFQAEPRTVFEVAMGATVLPLADEIDPTTFLPSSRSIALRREALERVAGYPEWLDYCEDLVFDIRLKQADLPFAFVPVAIAHFRPRPTLRAYFLQYYRYARGDGKADLWRKRHIIRYITYLVALPALNGLALLWHPLAWLLLAVAGYIYLRQPLRRLPVVMGWYRVSHSVTIWDWLAAYGLVPIIRVVGDAAKMLGYPVGWRWRLRNQPPDWHYEPDVRRSQAAR